MEDTDAGNAIIPLRLRFSNDIAEDEVVIGRALVRAMQAVELDYANRAFLFSTEKAEGPRTAFGQVLQRVPLFSDPILSDKGITLSETPAPDGLMLLSKNHQVLATDQTVGCWHLVRTVPTGRNDGFQGKELVDGYFLDAGLQFMPGELLVRLVPANAEEPQALHARIHHQNMKIMICVGSSSRGHRFLHRSSSLNSRRNHMELFPRDEDESESEMVDPPGCLWPWMCGRTSRIYIKNKPHTDDRNGH